MSVEVVIGVLNVSIEHDYLLTDNYEFLEWSEMHSIHLRSDLLFATWKVICLIFMNTIVS